MVGSAQDFPDFTNGVLLLGVDASGNQVGVLRVSAGNLNCILTGQGTTGLQTVAVDANGRLETFILDAASQWGDVLRVGNAELAARLGSAKSWDWRGDQYFFTDWSKGPGNILKYPSGTGSEIVVDPTYWVNGGYSLKMVGGSDASEWAYFNLYLDHPPSLRMGLEVQISGDNDFDHFYIQMKRYLSGKIYWGALKVEPNGVPDMFILNDAGTWIDVGDSFLGVNIEMFNHMKLVVDFEDLTYERVMWGETEVDVSAYDLYQSGTGYLNQVIITCHLQARSGNNDVRYLDYLLCTVNEPENA
jgi:hypothetical protein